MDAPIADPAVEAEPAPAAAPVAEAPIPDPNPDNLVVVPEIGPTGPASVTADTPVLLGPGPEFGLLASAPAGSMVEQTGNVVNGWVTVKFAEITGWAPLTVSGHRWPTAIRTLPRLNLPPQVIPERLLIPL